MAPVQEPRIHYTVIVRLPFPRRDFEDPPQVNWDAAKDRKLWKIISRNPKSGDIDWADRAADFGVTQTFLLQQAAWLYERHLQHVKAQMTKIRSSSNATTPVPGGSAQQMPQQPLTSVAMKRLGSGGASRTPSSLSIRKDSPISRADASSPGTPRVGATPGPVPPPLSRTPSTNTVTQSRHFLPPSPRQRNARPATTTVQSSALGRRFERDATTIQLSPPAETTATSSPASSSSSSSSSSSEEIISRSHAFRRPPRFRAQKPSLADIDNEDSDDEDSPTFLPFAQPSAAHSTAQQPRHPDPSATLRDAHTRSTASRADGRSDDSPEAGAHRHRSGTAGGSSSSNNNNHNREADAQHDGVRTPDRKHKGKGKQPAIREAESSPNSSSAGSAAFVGVHATHGGGTHPQSVQQQQQQHAPPKGKHHRLDTLSPRHRAELARLSPRRQGSKASTGSGGHGHENSDGTPSMGSSFSDLDDTSITQSALEEALASNLRHGGTSRLSNLSHAFSVAVHAMMMEEGEEIREYISALWDNCGNVRNSHQMYGLEN